ncbi:unnamed protein product [Kluyveromyces dobzhanskii CBS 2104]|uniref:WGS project CCBQ000000000 data, contig 00098 n=1 Tax=Kluyveromyces dobzhanskii CBS 2104 TaxID=1427455 RepID=A0A0A8L5V1_9SACH|nr:unnamed protein product [Kluyveromyces dobzhanskii CBS 2104]
MTKSNSEISGDSNSDNNENHSELKRFKWIPTERLIPGTVVRAFLPLKKCPELVLKSSDYADLYPGDEVYVVEQTKDKKWCRGYVSNDLMPIDFMSNMGSVADDLPTQKIQLLIFPRRFVHLNFDEHIESYPFLRSLTTAEIQQANDISTKLPSLQHLMNSEKKFGEKRPPYPFYVANKYALNREILLNLFTLTKHIYYLYSFGEFEVVDQMVDLYYKLDEARIQLQAKFMTSNEKSLIMKRAIALMCKISKYIASHLVTKRWKSTKTRHGSAVHGFESILTRDGETGDLLTDAASPQLMATSTSLYAMTTNYPLSNTNDLKLKPDENVKFKSFASSQILVDCQEIIGTLISELNSEALTAYLYLRTAKEVLTEPFIIDLLSTDQKTMNNISAALFTNIPYDVGKSHRVYLVVEIIETLHVVIDEDDNQTYVKPFVPFAPSAEDITSTIRRGVVAGATDISRVFSKGKGALASGNAYNFKLELFSSFYTDSKSEQPQLPALADPAKLAKLMKSKNGASTKNNGWGDLIDRIINDSHTGIAATTHMESLVASVKEIKGDCHFLQSSSNNAMAITTVGPMFYDTLSAEQSDRIYLTLDRVSMCGLEGQKTNVTNLTIKISSSNEKVSFRPSGSSRSYRTWAFVTVRPGELVNETIRIDGLEAMTKEETLRVSAYLNGRLYAKSRFYVKKGHQIVEYKKKSVFQLISSLNMPLVEIEVGTKYVGSNYNMDRAVYTILSLLRKHKISEADFEQICLEALKALKVVSIKQIVKYFNALLLTLLELVHYTCYKNSSRSSDSLKQAVFTSLVQFLDMNIARHDIYKHLFNDFIEEVERDTSTYLPEVGPVLMKLMSEHFSCSATSWTYVGRSLCRSYLLILKLGRLFSKDMVGYHESVDEFFSSICVFFKVTNDSVLVDQLTILETFDLALIETSTIFDDFHLIQLTVMLFNACEEKEDDVNFSQDDLSSKEKNFVNAKYLLLRRIIQNPEFKSFYESPTENPIRTKFLGQAIEWCFKPFIKEKGALPDLTTASYANGVLITIIEGAQDAMLKRNLIRLLPIFCRIFLFLRRSCEKLDCFRFKRVFSPLFPTMAPLPEITVDSMVTDEVFAGVLIETTTIIIALTRIVEQQFGSDGSFVEVIEACREDEGFQSAFYVSNIVREDLVVMFSTIQRLIKGDFFPSRKWFTMTAATLRACMTLSEMCLDVFKLFYVPNEQCTTETFDADIWGKYFKLVLSIANHNTVNSTPLAPLPRKAVYLITGDLIGRATVVLEQIWDALGDACAEKDLDKTYGVVRSSVYQMSFLRAEMEIVTDFCAFAFLRHIGARRVGGKIMWAVVVLLWINEQSLRTAVEEFTPQFFDAYQKGILKPTAFEVDTFFDNLLQIIRLDPKDSIKDPIFDFIRFLKAFLFSLAETDDIPSGSEFDDDRTASQLNIFGYLMSMKRPEMLHTLVNDLFINHMRRKDFIQAALSLELLALTYDWNPNDTLPATKYPPLPEQSSFERREYLYKEAARNFTRGLKLEKALTVYKDLADAYDEINYDLDGLSYVHGQISNIYTDLQSVDRLVPNYFKVSFYGFGFPRNLRGKTFIFEGMPFEHITSVHNRLLKLYPGSKLVNSFYEAEKLLVSPPNGKFIHVISVEPRLHISDEYATSDKKNEGNNKVRLYVENRDLKTFSSSRKVAGTNGITDLWVIEYIFETKSTFPTLMNRSEVVNVREKRLSPINNAIKSLQQKIQELSGLEDMCYKLMKENGDCSEVFSELSRNISGTIDAPINGGIAAYRVFYTDEETKSKLEPADVELLAAAFNELAIILNRCLALHGQLCPVSLMKSHTLLKDLFSKNFQQEIEACELDVNQTNDEIIARIKSIQSSQQSFSKRSSTLMSRSIFSETHSMRSAGSNGSATRNSLQDLSTTYSQRTIKSNAPSQSQSHATRVSRPNTHISMLRSTR